MYESSARPCYKQVQTVAVHLKHLTKESGGERYTRRMLLPQEAPLSLPSRDTQNPWDVAHTTVLPTPFVTHKISPQIAGESKGMPGLYHERLKLRVTKTGELPRGC